jgi:MFS family permease
MNQRNSENRAAAGSMRRAVAAATVGNALEFYDFITFAFFAIQIGKTFFPAGGDPFVSLMGSLATFGAGFLSRPLGAWVLGGYADRHGRKPAMLASMLLMGLGIALLALTPSYAAIGVAAPIIAVMARLIQGFALGGEVGSATTYLLEAAAEHRRGLIISLQGVSQAVASAAGALVGLALSLMLSEADLTAYGWRIALLLGTAIVPFAILIRRSLPETLPEANAGAVPAQGEDHTGPQPYARVVICGVTMIGAATIATYIFTYMATFAQNTLKLPASVAFSAQVAINLMQVFATLLGGWLSDRYGRRPLLIGPGLAFVSAIIPCFLWLTHVGTPAAFIGANVVLAFLSFLMQGPMYAAISEGLPARVRARVFALVYALPVTILGGSTQLVVTWLLEVTGKPMALAWYLTGVTTIGVLAMFALRETAPVRRRARLLAEVT